MHCYWSGAAATPNTSTATFAAVNNALNNLWNANEEAENTGVTACPISDAIVVTSITAWCATAPGGTASYTLVLRSGLSSTAASLTITGSATTGSWQGAISLAQLAQIDMMLTPSGSPAQSTVYWIIEYYTAGNFYLIPCSNSNFFGGTGVYYQSPMGGNSIAGTTTATNQGIIIPTSLILTKISTMIDVPDSGGTYTVQPYNVTTSTASTFSAVASTLFTPVVSSAGTMALTAGQQMTMKINNSGSTWCRVATCLTVVPGVPGEIILGYASLANLNGASVCYESVCGMGNDSWGTTESTLQMYLPPCTLTKLYTSIVTASGAAKSWTFAVRSAAAATGITCTLTNVTTANDTTHQFVQPTPALVDMAVTPASSPAACAGARFGFVQVIPQPMDALLA
jgi:hypothetical protein